MAAAIHTSRRAKDRKTMELFLLDWSSLNSEHNNTIAAAALRQVGHQVPRQIKLLFDWVRPYKNKLQDIGSRFRDLTTMRLDIPEPEEWWAVQALGRGGFGAVMMFQKYNNATAEIIDEIVVKTAKATTNLGLTGRPGISMEAAIMAQTNNTDRDGLLALRGFKCVTPRPRHTVPASPSSSQESDDGLAPARGRVNDNYCTWRYYFELCEHGDLERLRVKYKAYGRFLPEPFLWHLFYWLAESLERYAEGIENNGSDDPSYRYLDRDRWGGERVGAYLLHNDIKPHNIFLGDIDGPQPHSYYPIPRIGDLGLAGLATGRGRSNRAYNMEKGSRPWIAPEQRSNLLRVDTPFYPFGSRPNQKARPQTNCKRYHQITTAANVVAIGMVMFQMLTLREFDLIDNKIEDLLTEETYCGTNYRGKDVCMINLEDMKTIRDSGPELPYSDTLRETIMKCLMLNPEDRISEADLKAQTLAMYEASISNLPGGDDKQANVETNARVYFAQNDIHMGPLNPDERRYAFSEWGSDVWWRDRVWRDMMWQQEEWGWHLPPDMPHIDEVGTPDWPQGLAWYMMNSDRPGPETAPEDHPEVRPAAAPARTFDAQACRPPIPILSTSWDSPEPAKRLAPILENGSMDSTESQNWEPLGNARQRPTGRNVRRGAGIGPVRTSRRSARFDPLGGRGSANRPGRT